MSLFDLEKSSAIFFVMGILAGVQFFSGGVPFYSTVELPLNEGSNSHLLITKTSLPFFASTVKIEIIEYDSANSKFKQDCYYHETFHNHLKDLAFLNSDEVIIWSNPGYFTDSYSANPNIEIDATDCNDSDIWSVKIKMNSEPAFVYYGVYGNDNVIRSF